MGLRRTSIMVSSTRLMPRHFSTTYSEPGGNRVETLRYADGRVHVNDTQYFGDVPPAAWETFADGYQSAQKWLKDKKGRALDFDDIQHYASSCTP